MRFRPLHKPSIQILSQERVHLANRLQPGEGRRILDRLFAEGHTYDTVAGQMQVSKSIVYSWHQNKCRAPRSLKDLL